MLAGLGIDAVLAILCRPVELDLFLLRDILQLPLTPRA
jgi:hypothetical protein